MSWSVNFMGKPENIVAALQAESGRLTGASKVEYDACLPNLITLVALNYNNAGPKPVLSLSANGHAYTTGEGTAQYGSCNVTLTGVPGILV